MTRKLDKEHLDEIQALRDEFSTNSNMIGSLHLEQLALEQRIEFLKQEQQRCFVAFESLRKQESELLDKMRERYGDGQININDGTFISNDGLSK
jgi:uncharacterized iron-regulated protein